ncbi:MAG: hypothetical protein LC115_05220 [Bacteroidia bacterium]|nr:hypothetical protein [Bacteroidia bacterium]
MNKYFIRLALTAIAVTAFIGCRKEDKSALSPVVISKQTTTVDDTVEVIDETNWVHYTVNVVPGGNATGGGHKVAGISGAEVTCAVSGKKITVVTGPDGQAVFNKLSRGNVTVTVRAQDHTTLSYTVTLNTDDDFVDMPFINGQRYASTMVVLFPTAGAGTATISGRAYADLNQMVAGNEAVAGIKVTAVMEDGAQLRNFVNHEPDVPGNVLNVMYENMVSTGNTNNTGDYSLSVPATGKPLTYRVFGDDFATDVITGPTTIERIVFSHGSKFVDVVSNVTKVVDLNY